MTRDDIIRMAREVFDIESDSRGRETFIGDSYSMERFAALVAAAEREACAALCDSEAKWLAKIVDRDGAGAAAQCAYKIRAQTFLLVPTK